MNEQKHRQTRCRGAARWAGLLTVALVTFAPEVATASSVSVSINAASSASHSAVQSVIQSTRDELWRNARARAATKCAGKGHSHGGSCGRAARVR